MKEIKMPVYDEYSKQSFLDIFAAIEPDKAKAANMRVSATILSSLLDTVKSWGLTQKEASQKLGISQPRLNDLLKGRMGRFSLESLIELSSKAGLEFSIEVKKVA